eukprot:jgi/Tetstr1/456771/TSEL_004138.t1
MTAELVCNLYRRGSDNSAVAPSPWQTATPAQDIWDAVVKALRPRFKWDRNSHSGAHRLVCKACLTSLDLSKCFLDFSKGTWGGSDELLPPPLQQIPRLTALDLAQCDALTDRVLAAI